MSAKQEQFIHDLVQFYRNRGINNANAKQFVARLNGKLVNLCELYSYVVEYGGSYKVNAFNLWDEIYCKLFKSNYIGANFAVALRQIFNRYLLQFEKANSANFAASEQWNEDEDEENLYSNINQSNALLNLYKQPQDLNNVTDSSGQIHNDTKLYCSLLSGLPNELNFAFNVSTILSNCNRFDWTNDYKFINVLLESIKSYCCICDQFEEDITFGRASYADDEKLVLLKKFIHSSIKSADISKEKTPKTVDENGACEGEEFPSPPCSTKKEIQFIERNCNCYRQYWYRICVDEEVLSLLFGDNPEDGEYELPYVATDIPLHLLKKIEQRIELIAGIILNISATYDHNSCNVSMIELLKFLILLLRSDNATYLNVSLDILSNIAPALSFSSSNPRHESYYPLLDVLLRSIVQIATTSNNIHNTTKSFEVLARYISCMNNEANLFLENHFQNVKLYERITHLLTCRYDIALLLALLEFCLTLSEARPFLLIQNDNKIFLKILINFLNCDASQHFTTGAFKKVKIIDDRPRQEIPQAVMANIVQHNNNDISNVAQVARNVTPANTNSIALPSVNQNILDSESFAINWLKTAYEDASGYSFKVNDVYAEYVKHCCRNSRKNVIAAQSFCLLIRRCFPNCILSANQTIVEGLAVRGSLIVNSSEVPQRTSSNSNTVISQHPQLMSPILKAHLSTPPKNNALPIPNTPSSTSEINHTSTTNTSTLIKSLLANKLRNNQQALNSPNTFVNQTNNNIVKPAPSSSQQTNEPRADLNAQKTVVVGTNPATSFALTSTSASLANNSFQLVSSPNIPQQSSQLQAPQQFFVVRTILSGQQNPQNVRLILPASMLQTQQRLQLPVVSTVNGLATSNNVVQTISTQAQLASSTSTSTNNVVTNSIPPVTTLQQQQQTASAPRNSIANSSPLLNVLLDKGKLPDFPVQDAAPPSTNSVVSTNATSSTTSTIAIQPNQQPKMYILTTTPSKPVQNTAKPNSETPSDSICTSTTSSNNVAVNSTAMGKASLPTLHSAPLVNGDVKPLVANNSLIKHALETPTTIEITKKLKTSSLTNETNHSEHNETTDSNDNSVVVNNHVMEHNNSTASAALAQDTSAKNEPGPSTNDSSSSISAPSDASNQSTITASSTVPTVHNSSPVISTPSAAPAPAAKVEPLAEYECQWNQCQMKFVRPSEVFFHVHSSHIMTASCPDIMNCLWGGPDGKGPGCQSKRPKLSLLTHLQDFHCNPAVLKQELLMKKQISVNGHTNILLPQPPAHPGYAQNAAMLAIRRHATNYVESATAPIAPLSPLTVSIRLTSALILRNLALRSHMIKKSLELFEPQLCEVSISEGRDESRTIAQCLAAMCEQKHH